MSYQGKQLTPEMVELIVQLKKHHDEERKKGRSVSTRNPAGRTAASLGIGIATVKRAMATYKRSGNTVVRMSPKRPGRPPTGICQNAQPVVRRFIREQNLDGQRVSVNRVRNHLADEYGVKLSKTTLWRGLNRWGFTFGQGRRRDSLKEQDRVIRARRDYLRAKRANRNPDGTFKRPEVYLDETYINKNHSSRFTWYLDEDGPWVNKPSGVGPRLIVVHAITRDGWVDGAELVFEAKKRTGDYHGQMNWDNFSKWFETQLLPNIPPRSLIILDNAKYHNVLEDGFFPSSNSTKVQLRSWLTRNGYAWREDMLKSELLALCTREAPVPEYRLDQIALRHDMTILRTPPYHPELQPIETCWAVVKNYMADNCDFTMRGLRRRLPEGFSQVTSDTCAKIIKEVAEEEDRFWLEDEKLDHLFTQDAEEEYLLHEISKEEGIEPYLEEL